MGGSNEKPRIITSQIGNLIFRVDECFAQTSVRQGVRLLKYSYTVVSGANRACMEEEKTFKMSQNYLCRPNGTDLTTKS